MFEELQEDLLAPLEKGVQRLINHVQQLKQEKEDLIAQIDVLGAELQQRDSKIQELTDDKDELRYVESELKALKEAQARERQEVEREKAEIQKRLEGIMGLLSKGINPSDETEAVDETYSQPTVVEQDAKPPVKTLSFIKDTPSEN